MTPLTLDPPAPLYLDDDLYLADDLYLSDVIEGPSAAIVVEPSAGVRLTEPSFGANASLSTGAVLVEPHTGIQEMNA